MLFRSQNQILIENVKNACVDLNDVSGETLENADDIQQGTGEQEQAVEGLKQIMDQLMEELNNSVNASVNITAENGNVAAQIVQTQSRMGQLRESMQNISEMSMAIEKIIDEINEISDGLFDNITIIDQYALSTSKQVLKILIQYACLGQNCGPIELGRKKIGEIINREWLIQHFMEVADESINYFDEWEYRRLVELVYIYIFRS